MDVYFSRESIQTLEAKKIIATQQNSDGIILGHKRGQSFFVEKIVSTTRGFFPSLEKYYSLNTIYKDSIVGFYSFFHEEKKTKKILAPFAHGKLYLDVPVSTSNLLKIKAYSIEYDKTFFFSPLKLTLPQSKE
ncbi:MAG: hypothetical protein MUP98_05275 [Candidatus Aminicenantes bacterium]|nr:hypothetical protein [Candidatus Aminicenantes bacterium]